ncbi:MAG: ABC transporter ATP-binding protein [Firmicutes bacterium]|nr:ABC transporter ATP-binding protein [Bacillota bacterium]
MSEKTILDVRNLSVSYITKSGLANAVQNVSLTIAEREIVGLVGESGCGKSTLAQAIMRLLGDNAMITGGSVRVNGEDVYALKGEALRQFRWSQMSMVFQSAMNVLNPVKTIESQIVDTLQAHVAISKREARERAQELFSLVRIDPKRLGSYPHELSGGMRQRVVIAMAVALEPKLIVMDEPTTALDVVVQKSILEQIKELQEQVGFAVLFISHDVHLVSSLAARVGVMYAGQLVELSPGSRAWRQAAHHPYTQGLVRAMPTLLATDEDLAGIPGSPPNLLSIPPGCPFHPRCPHARDRVDCSVARPQTQKFGDAQIACHLSPSELRGLDHAG